MRIAIFVCTGNTCRSPMAEAIARHWLLGGELGDPQAIFVASAGTAAAESRPIAREAERALQQLGIEHEGSTKPLTAEMVRKAHLILCMTEEHVRHVRELVAEEEEHAAKVVLLNPEGDFDDPVGMGQRAYDELARRLQTIVPIRLKELLGHEDRARIGSSR